MGDLKGLEIIEADLLFFPLTVYELKPVSTIAPHPSEVLVRRDQNFKIELEMKGKVSDPRKLDIDRNVRVGTVTEAENTQGVSKYGNAVVYFKGIASERYTSNPFSGEFTLYGSAMRVIEELNSASDVSTMIVYVLGFPTSMASRISERNSTGEITLNRPDTPELGVAQSIKRPVVGSCESFARDCILLKGKYGSCLLSKGSENELSRQFTPSYLHFANGDVVKKEDVRRAFLEAVNFIFGKRFIEVGYTDLDKNNEPIRRSARSPYSLNIHAEVAEPELPPISIIEGYGITNETVVSKIVDLFVDVHERFNLSDVMWNIWTARMMPLGLELVAYAAALEALINAWFSGTKNPDRSNYVPDNEFKTYTDSHIKALRKEVPATSYWKRVVDRIGYANQLSITDRYKRFFEGLGLETGKVEDEVIKSRHKYAHGGSLEDGDIKRLVVIARAYEALLNRCILKIIGFQGAYRDYSTMDFPERGIAEPLGGPNNDGKI